MTIEQNRLSRELDQFYTSTTYAAIFLHTIKQHIDLDTVDIILEPSAGSGSFFNLLDENKRIGVDIDPKSAGIIKQDFLLWKPVGEQIDVEHIITIGNPPFGKNANLAVKFFNHSASFSEYIAFILPRTFRKSSIINRLDKHFHLIYDELVPTNSFVYDNTVYDVPCCAQIWEHRLYHRKDIPILNFSMVKDWFEIVPSEKADFSIQRVGAGAGTIRYIDFKKYSEQSHYFIKQHSAIVLDIFKCVDFDSVKFNTAGNPSVSASELVSLWCEQAIKFNIYLTKKD